MTKSFRRYPIFRWKNADDRTHRRTIKRRRRKAIREIIHEYTTCNVELLDWTLPVYTQHTFYRGERYSWWYDHARGRKYRRGYTEPYAQQPGSLEWYLRFNR